MEKMKMTKKGSILLVLLLVAFIIYDIKILSSAQVYVLFLMVSIAVFIYASYSISELFHNYKRLANEYQEEVFFSSFVTNSEIWIFVNGLLLAITAAFILDILGFAIGLPILLFSFFIVDRLPKSDTDLEKAYKEEMRHESGQRHANMKKEDRGLGKKRDLNTIIKVLLFIFAVLLMFLYIVKSATIPDYVKYTILLSLGLVGALLFEGLLIKYTKKIKAFYIILFISFIVFEILSLITSYAARNYYITQTNDAVLFGSILVFFVIVSLYLSTYVQNNDKGN
ncbi:MAG: hypothetical protein KGI06_04845 [Candidatus Micrarchaeota archaeon]|nr:hypothetical protein [Candidatus Micrarchaeota archaeon]